MMHVRNYYYEVELHIYIATTKVIVCKSYVELSLYALQCTACTFAPAQSCSFKNKLHVYNLVFARSSASS